MPRPFKALRKMGRVIAFTTGVWLLLLGTASLVSLHQSSLNQSPTEVQEVAEPSQGWGAEALDVISHHARQLSPIPLANACGLGASSCFRCHNGRRAAAPDVTEEKGLWHKHHSSVNYSCTGCHQGNPRILKQEIAHTNLVVNPLTIPEKTCGSCHNAEDVKALVPVYGQLNPRLIEHVEKGN